MGRPKKVVLQQIGEITAPTVAPVPTVVSVPAVAPASNKFDICFAFDTTGSMSGCISQVKQNIQKIVKELFKNIPNVRISLVAFEDYDFDYVWKAIDFTTDEGALIHFMTHMDQAHCITGRDIGFRGGRGEGMEESYEYLLHKIPSLNWSSESMRSLILIGDAPPHTPSHAYQNLDWMVELGKVRDKGINIYSVHCLSWGNEPKVKHFFKTIAKETNGYHLYLDQFTMIPAMMMAICYKQMGSDRLESYENELKVSSAGVTHGMRQVFDIMLGKKSTEEVEAENEARFDYSRSSSGGGGSSYGRVGRKATSTGLENLKEEDFVLKPSPPSRFQVLAVPNDEDIMTFSANNGLTFQRGKGFYHFTKPELIQKNKEIVLREKSTGDFFEGNMCRKMLNLITYDENKRIKPTDFPQYDIFIQSTSLNRKLIGGSQFLYDTMA